MASWGKCDKCGLVYQSKLVEDEVADAAKAQSSISGKCQSCRGKLKNKILPPSVHAIPDCLKGLSDAQWRALQPLMLSQGETKKHKQGYIRREKLSMLRWSRKSIAQKIADLGPDGAASKAANKMLMDFKDSPYKAWVDKHNAVLQNHAHDDDFKLSFDALLEPYVETALWPHPHATSGLCESHLIAPRSWSPLDKKGRAKVANESHASMKAQYVKKLMSDISDYATRYDLLQFQFDRLFE